VSVTVGVGVNVAQAMPIVMTSIQVAPGMTVQVPGHEMPSPHANAHWQHEVAGIAVVVGVPVGVSVGVCVGVAVLAGVPVVV